MKKHIFLLLLIVCIIISGYSQQTVYWQQQVNYNIDVSLNDAGHSLEGYIKMNYINNSPDTLNFIWIHIWPNAYKNDRTAFSDQLIENGNTDFYFSRKDDRGYINRLDFKVNKATAKTEDHPVHQDIIKLILPQPLLPKSSCTIETPFHVKLPNNFSRGGHMNNAYQITQWYPKPAVYDHKGWHPIPYLDQGEFYSEFGNYTVQITLPEKYTVASTGIMQEKNVSSHTITKKIPVVENKKPLPGKRIVPATTSVTVNENLQTLRFVQNNVHDFAWFADQSFTVKTDTLQLSSGRIITVNAYYYPANEKIWRNSISFIKQAVLTKSKWLGEYPYDVVSVVEDKRDDGGMEYPTITFLSSGGNEKSLDFVINHEIGHNWFYGILASNERLHPWMDEGMNTYYDTRYMNLQYKNGSADINSGNNKFVQQRMPDDILKVLMQSLIAVKKDQPIETASEKFSETNYNGVAYGKTGMWMQLLEIKLGTAIFDSCMHVYFQRWAFKHPYPEDFKAVLEEVRGANLDSSFDLLQKKGNLQHQQIKKDIRLSAFFNFKDATKHHYIFAAPAIGYNFYDKIMPGIALHNYTLPASRLQFAAVTFYASKSKQFNGIGRIGYSWFPGNNGQKVELSLSGSSFTSTIYTDSVGTSHYLRFSKIVPSFKYTFANKDPRSSLTKFIQWKTYIINEQQLLFTRDNILQIDIITYPFVSRYIN
ncbi:MAG: M1 family metallopeptidase, partial [Ferruginibacter sp.]